MALGTKFFRKVMADSLPLHVGQVDHTPMVHHCHFENKFKFAYFEIGSTHCPALLDHLEPQEVILCEKKDGFTKLQRASNVVDIDQFREHFTLGELWSQGAVGAVP